MKSVFIILLLVFPCVVLAQDSQYLDSLNYVLQHTANDTIKMDTYRKMGFYLQNGKLDSALYCHQQQLAFAKKLNLKLYEADAHEQIAYVLLQQMDLSKALENYNQALKIASEPNSAENGWGYANFSFSKSPADARLSIIGMVHFELSMLYDASRMFDEEKLQLHEALKIGEKLHNPKILSLTTRNIGMLFAKNNQPDSALYYYQKTLIQYKNSPYQVGLGDLYRKIGRVYVAKQQYDSAKVNFRKSINAYARNNVLLGLSSGYLELGKVFLATDQRDCALHYSLKVIASAESFRDKTDEANGYTQLSTIYESLNKSALALHALKKGKSLQDSLNNAYVNKLIQVQNTGFQERLRLKKIADDQAAFQNKLKMTGLIVVLAIIFIIALLLYRNNRQKKKMNKVLKQTLSDLKGTQAQLIQAEKMASLGELTAGIAHEIQNPLNFVNNFSEVSTELLEEMREEIENGNFEEVKVISSDLNQNLEKILTHGRRADGIVKGMLQHSRGSSGEKEPTDINALADEYLRLSYHGLRARDKSFTADFKLEADSNLPKVNVVPQDIGRVLLNLINNAFYAVSEKAKQNGNGYKPSVIVGTHAIKSPSGDSRVKIRVKDNGNGIPDEVKKKIFQPFFTTKPTGQGTGLGLSMSYDIVKAHGGTITMETEEGEGTEFSISLP
ncbi:MAG TPA: ATP-binding protein [Balneolales bacterium]|nr:ATP-binding protein [Balneolales bacterium]